MLLATRCRRVSVTFNGQVGVMNSKLAMFLAAIAATFFLAACEQAEDAADAAVDAVEEAGDDVADAAEDAGDAIEDACEDATGENC